MLQQGGYENAKGERTESSVGMLKKIDRRLLIEAENCCGPVSLFCSSIAYRFLFKKNLDSS